MTTPLGHARPVILFLLAILVVSTSATAFAPRAEDPLLDLARDPVAALSREVVTDLARLGELDLAAPGYLAAAGPHVDYRDHRMVCDLDGDGVTDVLAQETPKGELPKQKVDNFRLRARSGATGDELWARDGWAYGAVNAPDEIGLTRYATPLPRTTENVAGARDFNGDGVCDFVVIHYAFTEYFTTPPFRQPQRGVFDVFIRGVSGATGADVWNVTLAGDLASVAEPVAGGAVDVATIRGFPRSVTVFDTADGPRALLHVMDVDWTYIEDTPGVTTLDLVPQQPGLMDEAYWSLDARTTDHLTLFDAATGEQVWTRDLPYSDEVGLTNLTHVTGVADVVAEEGLEIILEQFLAPNPRGKELQNPTSGEAQYRQARGLRVTILSATTGADAWSRVVMDPVPASPNPPGREEAFERLVWTNSQLVGDIDGDGFVDPVAVYVTQEESLAATASGAFRTHFVPLSGATGGTIWNVRHQGWGFLDALGAGSDGKMHLAVGTVDVPTTPPDGGRFPPKFVRVIALDSTDGSTLWSSEHRFAQNSFLAYHLSLGQFATSLAPRDIDGDGIRDPVTPARYAPPTENDQLLLAASHHSYDVRDATDGATLATIDAWGPEGRLVACGDGSAIVIGGHGRRLDVTRVLADGSAPAWRYPVWNHAVARAATSAIDILNLGARCTVGADGDVAFSVNMQAYSQDRGHEIVSVTGVVDAQGALRWMDPPVRGGAPLTSFFAADGLQQAPSASSGLAGILEASAVIVLGALAAIAGAWLAKGRRAGTRRAAVVAAVAVAALFIALAFAPLATPAGAPVAIPDLGPSPASAGAASANRAAEAALDAAADHASGPRLDKPRETPPPPNDAYARLVEGLAALGSRATPSEHVALVRAFYADTVGTAPSSFEENTTLAYTFPVNDVDGDGVGDLAVDAYCLDSDACGSGDRVRDIAESGCSPRHELRGVSGATGDVSWRIPLDPARVPNTCEESFVLGTLPTGTGDGVLVYNYHVVYPAALTVARVITHRIYLVDAASGDTMWTLTETGTYAFEPVTTDVVENLLVNPLIQVPRAVGPLEPGANAVPALFLQGVGFVHSHADTLTGPPGFEDAVRFTDAYYPNEWAARIDPSTGASLWRTPTFDSKGGVSEWPTLVHAESLLKGFGLPVAIEELYWEHEPCCFDITGDGDPDLVYTVKEFAPYPSTNVEGPYMQNGRVVAFDGADGSRLYDLPLMQDVRRDAYALTLQPLGDVDGDGADDYAVHEELRVFEYRHLATVRSGRDGHVLWQIDTERDFALVPLGDADGDGATDVLVFDWFGWERGKRKFDDVVTPRVTPLRLLSGATGARIWATETRAAPSDVQLAFQMMRGSGRLDVNGDGVTDILVDDPAALGDQTMVHRLTVLSGRDLTPLTRFESVGAFAIPARAPDVTGDGRDEIAFLSGDVADLWLTIIDSATSESKWSRRVLAVPTSSYTIALPRIRVQTLMDSATDPRTSEGAVRPAATLIVNLHLYVQSTWTLPVVSDNGVRDITSNSTTIIPQMMRFTADDGALAWAFPRVAPLTLADAKPGPSPGTQVYLGLLAAHDASVGDRMIDAAKTHVGLVAQFAVGYALGAILLALVAWRRRRSAAVEAVPSLD